MGRYSVPLAPQLADFAGVAAGQRVLDVGSGPGALTTELVTRLGADAVSAVDPSEPFVAAARERHPGVDVQRAAAEQLPVRRPGIRRGPGTARRPLHGRPRRGPSGDGTRDARARCRGGVRLGPRRRTGAAQHVLGGGARARPGGPGRVEARGLAARASSPSSSGQRGCTTSRRPRFRSASSIRASRTGGSRTRSASGRRAATQPVSTRSGRRSCANGAARSCRTHRSCSRPAPGPPEASPSDSLEWGMSALRCSIR